jgi:pimeloyl-ACP methyl ester carboxylesterase
MKQLAAMRAYDATPRLPALAGVPTLIVGARHDRIATRDIVQRLAGHLPHGHVVEFDEAAHGVTIQCAETRTNSMQRGIRSALRAASERSTSALPTPRRRAASATANR